MRQLSCIVLLLISLNTYSEFKCVQEFILYIFGLVEEPIKVEFKNISPDTTLQECIDFTSLNYPQVNTTDTTIIATGRILKPKDFKSKLININGLIQPVNDGEFDNGKGYVNIHFL